MPTETLTPERILEATEDVLRRYGPAKATVVDVARVLGVSHGSVYRHFRTKAALREAVTQRWLEQAHATLHTIATADGPAPERLGRWLAELFAAKRRKAGGDPELFATYLVLVEENSGTVARHIDEMVGQIARILSDLPGLEPYEAAPTARAVWDATSRFHDPVYAGDWSLPDIDEAFEAVRELVLRGLVLRGPADPGHTAGR